MDRIKELEARIKELEAQLEALKADHSFLEAALDHLPNLIFVKNADAQFLYFNQAYAHSFGMDREHYLGKTVLELDYLPEQDRIRYNDEDKERIRKRCEESIVLPNGEHVTVSIGVAPLNREISLEANIEVLDSNLYRAKQQGRNRVVAPASR